ncbi:MAG: hypothetical protein NC131_03675 [Roseburia sp.]|nr:hypothetical protein [Roseburia sp.]
MTKRLKVYLLIVIAAACLACTVVGCKIGRPGRSEILAGYDTHVTYYSNGGYFDKSTTLKVRELYFKSENGGVPFFEITEKSKGMKVERVSYDFAGWYLPATYPEGDTHEGEIMYTYTYTPSEEDPLKPAEKADPKNTVTVSVYPLLNEYGNPLTDDVTDRPVYAREDGQGNLIDEQILERDITVVCSDQAVKEGDTVEKNIEDAHGLIVCARWLPSKEIEYRLVVTDVNGNVITGETEYPSVEKKEEDVKNFKNGDVLQSLPIAGEGEMPQTNEPVKLNGLTFVRTYKDEQLEENLEYIARPTDPDAENPKVYCRYIVGDWTVVRTAEDANKMFSSVALSTPVKFFVINDIEYGKTKTVSARENSSRAANVTIVCDKPHTISGLTVNVSSPRQGMVYSLFGKIGESFNVSGLTLKDVNITIGNSQTAFGFYAICSDVNGAVADKIDLKIENVTATYQGNPTINNATGEDRRHWLFGGESFASDEAFLAQFTGVKISGSNTLTKLPDEQS